MIISVTTLILYDMQSKQGMADTQCLVKLLSVPHLTMLICPWTGPQPSDATLTPCIQLVWSCSACCRLGSSLVMHACCTAKGVQDASHSSSGSVHRKQPEALAELQGRPSTRFVAVCGEDSAVVSPEGPNPATSSLVSSATDPDGEPVRWQPALLPRSQITDHLDAQTGMIFLGLDPEGSAVFAASIQPAARDTVAAASQVRCAAASVARSCQPSLHRLSGTAWL